MDKRTLDAIMQRVVKMRSIKRYLVGGVMTPEGPVAGKAIVIRDVKDFSKESYLKDGIDQKGYVYLLNNPTGSIYISVKRRILTDNEAPFGWQEYISTTAGSSDPAVERVMPFIFGEGKILEQYIAAVALGFYDDNRKLGLVVCHNNWLKGDNRPENLELCTLEQHKWHEATKAVLEKYGLFEPGMALRASKAYEIARLTVGNVDAFVNEVMKEVYNDTEFRVVYV